MANSHGIGVKRNDYHRKNRKENKGHRWRGARTVPAIRLIKPTDQSPVISRTAYEDKGFLENEDVMMAEEEYNDMKSVRSTLAYDALIFYPPFLKRNEIMRRRFAEMEDKGQRFRTDNIAETNDCWWEWEAELETPPTELIIFGLPDRVVENTAPLNRQGYTDHKDKRSHRIKTISRGRVISKETISAMLKCENCGHEWWPHAGLWKHGDGPKECKKCWKDWRVKSK